MTIEIIPAYAHLTEVKLLFTEYTQSLGIDLSFQNYATELAALPGKYAQPTGRLYLALADDGEPAGVIGLRAYDNERCEMKRLYVRPHCRGTGAGRMLAERIIADAREIGYRQMLLDTLPTMTSAQVLYANLGFYEIPPYYHNPVEGTKYLCLDL